MKIRGFKSVLLSFMMITSGLIAATTITAPVHSAQASDFTEKDEAAFYDQLQDGIKKSQAQYTQLKSKAEAKNATDKDREAVMNSATALEVKYTLYKNFYNTSSVKSPAIRNLLLKLFNKDFINLDDLTQLKKLVSSEKAKMGIPEVKQPAAPANEATKQSGTPANATTK